MGPTKPQSQVKRSPTAPTDEKSTSTGTSTDSSIPLAAGANGNNINNTGLSFTTKMLLLAGVLSLQFCWLTLGQSSSSAATDKAGSELDSRGCPSYTEYSQVPHGDRSSGPLALPFMRPEERCRTFNSSAVEKVITDMKTRLKDPDLARLFENTFPSTLDTTVSYFNADQNVAFIITGDITAQWLRDTGNQFAHLYKLLPHDDNLKDLVKAVINTEARYIAEFPYCGAFQPPPEAGLEPTHNEYADNVRVNPPVDNQTVFECKYELDSLCGFLKITRSYYSNTHDTSIINDNWQDAMDAILQLIEDQSRPSFDEDFNFYSSYNWTGEAGSLSGPVTNGGNGAPRAYNGLVATHHRPSDDLSILPYLVPANAMLAVELEHIAEMLEDAQTLSNVSSKAREYSQRIRQAVWDTTISSEGVFAYETDGFGGMIIMDDGNVPALLSLPYIGFLEKDDPTYIKTKETLLSRKNPYFAAGEGFTGVGGPHVNLTYPWPMSQISAIYGTDDPQEITDRLYLLAHSTSGLGLIHESVNYRNGSDFTRPWFAWANSYFAEMMLDLAERMPALIFEDDTPYRVGQ